MASKINKTDLGKNETRLMDYAGAVLQGLREANFTLIANVTQKLIQDQAIAQVVGWHSVEVLREKTELLELGLTKEQAEDLIQAKSSAPKPHQFFRAPQPRRYPRNQREGDSSSKSGKEKSSGAPPTPPRKKQ